MARSAARTKPLRMPALPLVNPPVVSGEDARRMVKARLRDVPRWDAYLDDGAKREGGPALAATAGQDAGDKCDSEHGDRSHLLHRLADTLVDHVYAFAGGNGHAWRLPLRPWREERQGGQHQYRQQEESG